MERNFIFIILLLALFTGQAEAQRRLPGMKAVRFTAEMADGFYSRADRHDAGYAFSLAVATYTKKGNQWVFGCEMLQRNNPYRNTYVPLSQYTGEGGYYHTILSTSGKSFFLSLGASAFCGRRAVFGPARSGARGRLVARCKRPVRARLRARRAVRVWAARRGAADAGMRERG